jgi:hypothetical protein
LASPPLTVVVLTALASLVLGFAGVGWWQVGLAAVTSVVSYVALGLFATRAAVEDLKSLVHAPRFVLHKVSSLASALLLRPRGWERTERG